LYEWFLKPCETDISNNSTPLFNQINQNKSFYCHTTYTSATVGEILGCNSEQYSTL